MIAQGDWSLYFKDSEQILLNKALPPSLGICKGVLLQWTAKAIMFSNRPPHSGNCFPACFLSDQQLFHQSISDQGQNAFFLIN